LGVRHSFCHGQKRDYLSHASQRARGATKMRKNIGKIYSPPGMHAWRVKKALKRVFSAKIEVYQLYLRWDPRDSALRPTDRRALHNAGRRVRSTASDHRRQYRPQLTVPAGAVNTRPTAVAVCITLSDGRRAVAKFSRAIVWNKVPEASRGLSVYWRYANVLQYSVTWVEGNLYPKKSD